MIPLTHVNLGYFASFPDVLFLFMRNKISQRPHFIVNRQTLLLEMIVQYVETRQTACTMACILVKGELFAKPQYLGLTKQREFEIYVFRCKNFFKRSVVLTQKKPYICNNLNKCDVRIVIDMSGIKRKGARCQACRYAACLDAGMFHSGSDASNLICISSFPPKLCHKHSFS